MFRDSDLIIKLKLKFEYHGAAATGGKPPLKHASLRGLGRLQRRLPLGLVQSRRPHAPDEAHAPDDALTVASTATPPTPLMRPTLRRAHNKRGPRQGRAASLAGRGLHHGSRRWQAAHPRSEACLRGDRRITILMDKTGLMWMNT